MLFLHPQKAVRIIENTRINIKEGEDLVIPVKNGKHLKEDYLGHNIKNYDSMLILSHFKGHPMGGYGGALKQLSIGVASSFVFTILFCKARNGNVIGVKIFIKKNKMPENLKANLSPLVLAKAFGKISPNISTIIVMITVFNTLARVGFLIKLENK